MAGAAEEWSVAAREDCADGLPAWIVYRCGGETVAECSREERARLIARLPLVVRELVHRVLQLEEVWWRLSAHGGSERLRQSIKSVQRLLEPWIASGCRSPGIAAAIEAGLMDEASVAAVRPNGEAGTLRSESARVVELTRWWPIPVEAIRDTRVNALEQNILAYLYSFQLAGRRAFPSYRRLILEILGADESDQGKTWLENQRRRFRRAVNNLEAYGYLEITKRYSEATGRQRANEFRVVSNGTPGGSLGPPSPGVAETPHTRSLYYKNSSSKELEEAHASSEASRNGKPSYADIYGAWRIAWSAYSKAPWNPSGPTQRDVTSAIHLGTLDGLDLERFFRQAISWLTTRKQTLTVSLRAAINNAPAIQHDLGSCELGSTRNKKKHDPRVAAAVAEANRIHRKAGSGGGEGEVDGERGSRARRTEDQSTPSGV